MSTFGGSGRRSRLPARIFELLQRRSSWVLFGLSLGLLAGLLGTLALPIDMSFRPTFIADAGELERTREHEQTFGQVGFRDLVAIVELKRASDPTALSHVADLAQRLSRIKHVSSVREPLHFPFFDAKGSLHPGGIAGSLPPTVPLDSPLGRSLIADLFQTRSARRLLVGDGETRIAVTASLDLPNEAFAERREAVLVFRETVQNWSQATGYATEITGYPEVEQVYAREVLLSVFRSIALLLLMMLGILLLYFRRWSDVITCLLGVTISVPLVLGTMAALGQPFSIVNSQVLTLVLIVGIGQALHHQEEYRRRREAGCEHTQANREAFVILAWPSFMTGFATISGFAALVTADMRAIWSFGLSTALGVAIVYAVNWLVVPLAIRHFQSAARSEEFTAVRETWTLAVMRHVAALVQRLPGSVVCAFVVVTALLAAFGLRGLSVDQRVNEELPSMHSAVRAERTYEQEFAGFLGPELAIRALTPGTQLSEAELATFVNRLCDMPEIRYVASALDFSPQPPAASDTGKACQRVRASFDGALAARSGALGPTLLGLALPVTSGDGRRMSVVVRVADIGTAHSLPFVARIREVAREAMPHAQVEPVGQWWLAQQGMNRLSFDVMFSAITALLVILPIMWFAIRDSKLFLAAIPATILPVFATLGFMGLMHITVRIGTAMILAIALGLAADDTIHLSVRIRDRLRAGSDLGSAVSATLLRTGRPCSFSSFVLIGGFASMRASSLLALQAMGLVAMFSMAFALATDVVLGPALFLLLARGKAPQDSSAPTLQAMLEHNVGRHPERPALSYRVDAASCSSAPAVFRTLTWHEFAHCVLNLAEELDRKLGDERVVAVLADTNPRYPVLELAVGLIGRTLQPLYVSASNEELRTALATSGARTLVVGPDQVARGREAALCSAVRELDLLVPLPGSNGNTRPTLPLHVEPFDSSAALARLRALPRREAGAALLYLQSTGTTGPARVIALNEAALLQAVAAAVGEASPGSPRFLSFLPAAHISERLLTLYVSLALAGHTYFGRGLSTLTADLRACRPTALLTPPLLLETLRTRSRETCQATPWGRALFAAVQRTTEALLESGVVGGARRALAARLFGWRLRRSAGLDQVRDFLAGAAPIPAELHAWSEAAGLRLRIVYGQTELVGVTAISPRTRATFGAVGLPVQGVELRLSADDELLVRSSARFEGYVANEEATQRTLQDEWLHTGDRARLLETREIVLIGRVQAIMCAKNGLRVDTAPLAEALARTFGGAGLVFAPIREGAALYVAFPSIGFEQDLQPLPESDPRWQGMVSQLSKLDPEGLVVCCGLFAGTFAEAEGEVGPTGKPRNYRIHARHSHQLRSLAVFGNVLS